MTVTSCWVGGREASARASRRSGGGVALDLDTQTVAFFGVYTYSGELRALYLELMRELWGPGWTVRWVDDMPAIAELVGVDPDLVRDPPRVEDPANLGSMGPRFASALVTLSDGEARRDLVVDQRAEELLMNGPALLEHLDKATPWREFLAREPEWRADDRRPLSLRIRTYVSLNTQARTLDLLCADARYDAGFLRRVLQPRWPGWRVEAREGAAAEHFAALERALPPALEGPTHSEEEFSSPDERVPTSFEERVAYIAELVLGVEKAKEETAAFAARVGQDVLAESDGTAHFAPGFFDRIPASGPRAGAAARFREAAEAVAARRAAPVDEG